MNYATLDRALEAFCRDLERRDLKDDRGDPALRVPMPRTQRLLARANALCARNMIATKFLPAEVEAIRERARRKR